MKRIMALWIIVCVLLLSGCGEKKETITFFSMDTVMEMTAYGSGAEEGLRKAEIEINRLSAMLDRGVATSELFLLNKNGEGICSADLEEILDQAFLLSQKTGGAFDPTLAPYSDLWGFYDGAYRVPAEEEFLGINAGWEQVTFDEEGIQLHGTKLDLGAIAKGYASDRAKEILIEAGVTSAVLSLGGNVIAIGAKSDGTPWTIAVTDPQNPSGYIGTVQVKDKAVVTSGNYERYFEADGKRYHHILDPKTGKPVENGLSAVTVIAESGTEADALSTAFYVMGMEKAIEYLDVHEEIDALFITEENEVYYTKGVSFVPREGIRTTEIGKK